MVKRQCTSDNNSDQMTNCIYGTKPSTVFCLVLFFTLLCTLQVKLYYIKSVFNQQYVIQSEFKVNMILNLWLHCHFFLLLVPVCSIFIGQRSPPPAAIGPPACHSYNYQGHFSPLYCCIQVILGTWKWDQSHGGTSSSPSLFNNSAAEKQCGAQTLTPCHGHRER